MTTTKKQILLLQIKIDDLKQENDVLKIKVKELEAIYKHLKKRNNELYETNNLLIYGPDDIPKLDDEDWEFRDEEEEAWDKVKQDAPFPAPSMF